MGVQAEVSDLLQVLALGFAASVPTWSSVCSSPDGRAGLVSRLRAGLEGALHCLRFPCLPRCACVHTCFCVCPSMRLCPRPWTCARWNMYVRAYLSTHVCLCTRLWHALSSSMLKRGRWEAPRVPFLNLSAVICKMGMVEKSTLSQLQTRQQWGESCRRPVGLKTADTTENTPRDLSTDKASRGWLERRGLWMMKCPA